MQVKSIMSRRVVTVPPTEHLDAVARKMLDKGSASAIVVDGRGRAAGILTERDFAAREAADPFTPHRAPLLFGKNIRVHSLRRLYREGRRLVADRAKRPIVVSLSPEDPIERAVDIMTRHGFLNIPVLRDGKPVGMVSRHDLLRLAARRPRSVVKRRLVRTTRRRQPRSAPAARASPAPARRHSVSARRRRGPAKGPARPPRQRSGARARR